jgi:hypothetical protein
VQSNAMDITSVNVKNKKKKTTTKTKNKQTNKHPLPQIKGKKKPKQNKTRSRVQKWLKHLQALPLMCSSQRNLRSLPLTILQK